MKFHLINNSIKITLVLLVVFVGYAHNATAGLKNVITVAKENGDFVSLKHAMNSIGDASPTNRYVVKLGPGFHNIRSTLVLKRHVSLVGFGKNTTIIRRLPPLEGDMPGLQPVIKVLDHTSIHNLTIRNVSGLDFSIGILALDVSYGGGSQIDDVHIDVLGGLKRNWGGLLVYRRDLHSDGQGFCLPHGDYGLVQP